MSDGTVILLREVPHKTGLREEEFEIPYTITKGSKPTWDDPGDPPEVELLPPAGIVLTADEEEYLKTRAAEDHDWDDRPDDDDWRDDDREWEPDDNLD